MKGEYDIRFSGYHQRRMKKTKYFQGFLAVAVFVFAVSLFAGTGSTASAKTKISNNKGTISVNGEYSIYLTGKVKNASYQFASKNKKVAMVSKKGVIKGVAAGKTKITVTQKLKKKKTKVGTFTITVKKAVICSDFANGIDVSNQPGVYSEYSYILYEDTYIDYANLKAKYKFYSSDKTKLTISTDGKITDTNGSGKVKVIVKETYKGKTRTVGSISVNLAAPSFKGKEDIELAKNETYNINDHVDNVARFYMVYTAEDKDNDPNELAAENDKSNEDDVLRMVYNRDGEWEGVLKAVGEGKRYVKLYAYDYKQGKYITTPFSQFTVTVKEIKDAEKISTAFDLDDSEYANNYSSETDTYTMDANDINIIHIYQTPYNYTGDIKVTSSDTTVVKVPEFEKAEGYDSEKGYIGSIFLVGLKEGSSTITVEANGAKREFTVNVKASTFYIDDEETQMALLLDKDVAAYDENDDELSEDDFTVKSSNEKIVTATPDEIYKSSDDKKVKAIRLTMTSGSSTGTATVSVYYKGEKVGSMKVTVVGDSTDDDY